MKVAVTGASGFVGKHVLGALLQRGVEVVAVTRMASRLASVNNMVRVVETDIAHSRTDFFEAMGRPDILIHLAWDGLPNYMSLHHFEDELPRQYQF